MKEVLPYLAIASSIITAGLGIRAATITIRDSIDDFIADLARQGRWAGLTAFAAGISALLQSADRWLQ